MKKKYVESSVGVHTTEATARKIDELIKGLPQSYTFRRKQAPVQDIEVEGRCDISTITTAGVDRDQEIVLPGGMDLTDYRANPVVLYQHDRGLPVGKCLWLKPQADRIIAKTQYIAKPKNYQGDWFPDYVLAMVQDVLRGKSVGFLPLEIREPNEDELARFPDVQTVISRSLLLEYSVVSVPCNPEALVQALTKGLEKGFFKVLGKIQKVRKSEPAPVQKRHPRPNPQQIADLVIQNLRERWEI